MEIRGKEPWVNIKKPKKTKDVKKIKISYVDPDIKTQRGLFGDGCMDANCYDICCENGCDVDLASLRLIYRYRHMIEPLIKAKLEDCFATVLKADNDYIGGAYCETAVMERDGRCAFHLVDRKGCSLFYLWWKEGLPKKIVPTICRAYPITWHRGRLFVDRPLRRACKCLEKNTGGMKLPSLYETQKREIRALFDIQKTRKARRKNKASVA
jgi:hypothetical protein